MISAIMIDSREPEWIQKLDFGGLPKSVQYLEQGDLWAATDSGELLVIERKTPDDFLGSLKSDRLFLQLANMRFISPWAYLMITGNFRIGNNDIVYTERVTGWSWAAVQGALLSIQELGVFVQFCNGDTAYDEAVLRLGGRDRSKVVDILPAKQPHILSVAETIIMSLPGIGIDKMKTVLSYAGGRAGHALCGLVDPEIKMPGISDGIKARVRRALGMNENETL